MQSRSMCLRTCRKKSPDDSSYCMTGISFQLLSAQLFRTGPSQKKQSIASLAARHRSASHGKPRPGTKAQTGLGGEQSQADNEEIYSLTIIIMCDFCESAKRNGVQCNNEWLTRQSLLNCPLRVWSNSCLYDQLFFFIYLQFLCLSDICFGHIVLSSY